MSPILPTPNGVSVLIRFLIFDRRLSRGHAVGLLVAVLLLPGFVIDPLSFVIAVGIFSLVQTVLGPLITKILVQEAFRS